MAEEASLTCCAAPPRPRCPPLLQGAQAIEVVPWVQEDKANLPEWVQAIRDSFQLDITLYDIQNHERPRAMFNQDVSALGALAAVAGLGGQVGAPPAALGHRWAAGMGMAGHCCADSAAAGGSTRLGVASSSLLHDPAAAHQACACLLSCLP